MSPTSRFLNLTGKFLIVILGLLTLFYAWQNLSKLYPRVTWHWANSLVEPQPVWGAMRVAQGKQQYIDFYNRRLAVPLTYGFLEYWIPGKIGQAFDLHDAQSITRIGRGLSALTFVGTILLIIALCRQRQLNWLLCCVAVGPVFWFPYATSWNARFVPDFPAIFFSLAGWYALRPVSNESKSIPRIVIAVLCWLITWHIKPIVSVGAVGYFGECIVLLRKPVKPWRQLLLLASPFMALALVAILSSLYLQAATSDLWWLHAASSKRKRWNGQDIIPTLIGNKEGWILIVMVGSSLMLRKFKSPYFLSLYIETAIVSVLLMKEGANINYTIGIAILFSIHLVHCFQISRWEIIFKNPLPSTIMIAGLSGILFLNVPTSKIFLHEMVPVTKEEVQSAAGYLNDNRPVLCLDPYFSLVYNLNCPYMDGAHAYVLEKQNEVSFKVWADEILACRYPVIIGNSIMYLKPTDSTQYHIPASIREAVRERLDLVYKGDFLRVSNCQGSEQAP